MMRIPPLLVAFAALAAVPFVFDAIGLPLRSSVDVVVLAMAAMGLNVLVGHTGLVSFGHGAWFGMGAYAAALSQRHLFEGEMILPKGYVPAVDRAMLNAHTVRSERYAARSSVAAE